jgi:hypothetical protein
MAMLNQTNSCTTIAMMMSSLAMKITASGWGVACTCFQVLFRYSRFSRAVRWP